MTKITIEITEEQKFFLELLKHEDAASNNSQAIQLCIDSCMKIERKFGIDACYIANNDDGVYSKSDIESLYDYCINAPGPDIDYWKENVRKPSKIS